MLTLESVIMKPMLHSTFIDFCMVLAKMSHDALRSAGTHSSTDRSTDRSTDSSTDSSREQLRGFNGGQQKTTSVREPVKLETPSLKPPPLGDTVGKTICFILASI